MDSEDSDQTGRMLDVQVIFLVLSCCGLFLLNRFILFTVCWKGGMKTVTQRNRTSWYDRHWKSFLTLNLSCFCPWWDNLPKSRLLVKTSGNIKYFKNTFIDTFKWRVIFFWHESFTYLGNYGTVKATLFFFFTSLEPKVHRIPVVRHPYVVAQLSNLNISEASWPILFKFYM